MWILANVGVCFAVLRERRGGVTSAFCLPVKKVDFYVLIVHVFVHAGFTVQVVFRFFPWHLFLELQICFFFIFNFCISVNYEFSCVQVYLTVVDRLQCSG